MKNLQEPDVIHVCGEDEDLLWLSERAENRLGWILTGVMALTMLPVFILPFLM